MRVFLRSLATCIVVTVLLVSTGCGGRADEPLAKADNDETAQTRQTGSGDVDLGFVPATYREGGRVVLPVTFPDGTTAELVFPQELEIAELDVRPYNSGTLRGKSPTPGRGDSVARDFVIRYGDLDEVLKTWHGNDSLPSILAHYEGADGQPIGFWDVNWNDNAHYLGFQFGRWTVLVYDYVGGGAMTEAERTSWAANFSGRETDDGFLLLDAAGPLRLARVGEHAGPELTFAAGKPNRALILFPGECRPHSDQTRLVAGKLVSWNGGFANWCLSDSMRIHAEGSREFIGAVIRELEVRNAVIAKS